MLTVSLIAVFLAFCLLMAGVLAFCLSERKRNRTGVPHTSTSAEREDKRVAVVLFSAMIAGVVLALMTGYLVFYLQWT